MIYILFVWLACLGCMSYVSWSFLVHYHTFYVSCLWMLIYFTIEVLSSWIIFYFLLNKFLLFTTGLILFFHLKIWWNFMAFHSDMGLCWYLTSHLLHDAYNISWFDGCYTIGSCSYLIWLPSNLKQPQSPCFF